MRKKYIRINWENYPSVNSPLNEQNLNRMDVALDEIDSEVVTLDTTKLDKVDAQTLVKNITFNRANGVFTITYFNNTTATIDTMLEKLMVNFAYDYQTQRLVITLDDGTKQYVDLSALITQYEFVDSDTIAFTLDANGKVSAKVKEGSIEEKHLRPNYLADVKVEVEKAEASAVAADASEKKAKQSETNAGKSEKAASASADEAAEYADAAAGSAVIATEKATESGNSAAAAKESEVNSNTSETNAAKSASDASASKNAAESSKNAAAGSAATASQKATEASTYADKSKSYAVGNTGTRENEDIDNSKFYYEQSKRISAGLGGALLPMGTVTFAQLPDLSAAQDGWMYNVSDKFTTTTDFKEGAGHAVAAGSNVYKTADGKWDILAGTPVSSINGRTGNVVLDKGDVGLGNVPNVATNDQKPTFTQAATRTNIASGEKLSTIFGKIMKWFADLKAVAFSGSYTDLSDKPTSLKNPAALTFTGAVTENYDGSSAKSVAIPSVGNGTVTIKQAGAQKGTFTMNQSGNTTIELTDNNTTYGTVSKSAPGLAPQLPNETTTTKYLRQDGTWTVPPNTTYSVATQSANGLQSAADKKKLDGIPADTKAQLDALNTGIGKIGTVRGDYFLVNDSAIWIPAGTYIAINNYEVTCAGDVAVMLYNFTDKTSIGFSDNLKSPSAQRGNIVRIFTIDTSKQIGIHCNKAVSDVKAQIDFIML